ncbi:MULTISPECIES: BA14K family protein [Chelativorans]|uniref:Lectin-like protein BA14k n=1 Tax=Chelativorans sp. (strain BNC1) TaxID=266779 RepID=Q11I82_CHESB
MKRALTALAICALAGLGLGATGTATQASALSAGASSGTMPVLAEKSNLVEIQHRDRRWDNRRWDNRRHWRRDRDRDRHWRRPRSGIYFEFGTGGFRYGPPAYVHPPYYAPPRYVAPRPTYGLSAAHVNWCYARYRSYRASDNTFQPYNGPRRVCVSPYLG